MFIRKIVLINLDLLRNLDERTLDIDFSCLSLTRHVLDDSHCAAFKNS